MSGYSDGESHGEGNDSDASSSTPDKVPVLPSVRKLASKFDLASRERVNDLDKHGKDGSLAFNGKKNIFIERSSPTDPPYSRNLTNNLNNKRSEKPYNVKEVRSSPNRSTPDPQLASDTDSSLTDHDDSEFDDQATVTSVSLPPTPHSLSGRHSFSTSSLLDSDSCYSVDYRDQSQAGDEPAKTIFGVTLRKVSSRSGASRSSRSSVPDISVEAGDDIPWDENHWNQKSLNSSTADLDRQRTPISETDSDSDAPNALRQVTIIKIHEKSRPEHQSMIDLVAKSESHSQMERRFSSSTMNLASEGQKTMETEKPPVRKVSLPPSLQPLNRFSRQKSMPDLGAISSIAFVPKGRKRTMREFLKSYQRQTSLSEINRIDEKVEEEWNNQRNGHPPLQRMISAPPMNYRHFQRKESNSYALQSDQGENLQCSIATSPTDNRLPMQECETELPPCEEEPDRPSSPESVGDTQRSNIPEESDDESSMSDSTVTAATQQKTKTETESEETQRPPLVRAKSVSDLLKIFSDLESKAGRSTIRKPPPEKEIQPSEAEVCPQEEVKTKSLEVEPPSPEIILDAQKVASLLTQTEAASIRGDSTSAMQDNKENTSDESGDEETNKVPLVRAKSISDLLKLYTNKTNIEEAKQPVKSKKEKKDKNKTIIKLTDNESHFEIQQKATKIPPANEPASVHKTKSKSPTIDNKTISYDESDFGSNLSHRKISGDYKANLKVTSPQKKDIASDKVYMPQTAEPVVQPSNGKTDSHSKIQVLNGTNANDGLSNRTIISLSDDSGDTIYHASIINIESEDSFSTENTDGPKKNRIQYSTGDSSKQKNPRDIGKEDLANTYAQVIPVEVNNTQQSNAAQVSETELLSKGPHVTVISVAEPPAISPPLPPSDESSEDDALCDPIALTRMIVHGSRCRSSRRPGQRKKTSITAASVPVNSPFSPLSRSSSASPDVPMSTTATHSSAPLHKRKLGPQDSFDEGVDFTLSDADLAQSAISTESKSTSSVDTIGEDNLEPRVLCT